jgi:hypothetical protein
MHSETPSIIAELAKVVFGPAISIVILAATLYANRLSTHSDFLRGKLEEIGRELCKAMVEVASVNVNAKYLSSIQEGSACSQKVEANYSICLLLAKLYFPLLVPKLHLIDAARLRFLELSRDLLAEGGVMSDKVIASAPAISRTTQSFECIATEIAAVLDVINSDFDQLTKKPITFVSRWVHRVKEWLPADWM